MPKLRLTKKLCFNFTLLILTKMATVPVTGKTDERGEVSLVNSICLPELLAPTGDWECARAAVENGADAIYFGLERFNARVRAHNFTDADLPKLMEFLHRRGVKGYVTFNTLVFENELHEAEDHLRTIISAGLDAAIVQDVGICRLIRQLSPDFPIHASTQMTITSAAGVEFARELGCNLVVLARECSIKEIECISKPPSTPASRPSTLPLEVFVHGALCVAYSGQCLTSEALGGRSANRGECAQACRMPYELICDGRSVPLGDRKYLLSPQDLAGLELLPELIRAGVISLKIEGRLKTPEYVANITRIYRQALDRITSGDSTPNSEFGTPHYDMEMAFSRGLYTGWLGGINNQQLVHARFGKKRGVYLGEVAKVTREAVRLKLEGPLKPGDGVVFDAGTPEQPEEGGRVYEIRPHRGNADLVELRFGHGDIDFARVRSGNKLWKTDDPELNRRLRQSFENDKPGFLRPLKFEVHGHVGVPLTMIARDELGHVVKLDSGMPLSAAENQPLTDTRLREQLGRLGGTPFRFDELHNHLRGDVLLPISELNRLRREAVAELERQRALPKRWALGPDGRRGDKCKTKTAPGTSQRLLTSSPTAELIILVRNLSQLEAAVRCGISTVYCDFEDPRKYREAVTLFHAARSCSSPSRAMPKHDFRLESREPLTRPSATLSPSDGERDGVRGHLDIVAENQSTSLHLPSSRPSIWVAPPRIFKTGEEWILKQVRSCNADGYLVRNYDHLQFFANDRRIGDFSLNIANRLAAEYFKNQFGLERVTASYDLNFQQLEALLRAAPAEWFEITIHQHMPMFHMEHCVFCAFLSKGTDYTNCGRPCDRHAVSLRDRVGAEHPLKADIGCRNTVFNALAQTGAEYVEAMLRLGVRHFRVEFVNESPEQIEKTIAKYRQLLRGEITGSQLWRELRLFNQLGVTRGQMAG